MALPATARSAVATLAVWWSCGVLAAAVPAPATAMPPVSCVGIHWNIPDDPPAPRALMSDDEYDDAKRACLARVDRDAFLDPDCPAYGVWLHQITPDGIAEHCGVLDGDLLVRLDGAVVGTDEQLGARDRDRPCTMAVWGHGAGTRTFAVPPGPFGVRTCMGSGWPFGGEFARTDARRDGPWFDDLLVAMAAQSDAAEPRLAETALHHAIAHGYAGRMTALLMCATAASFGHGDDCLRWGWRALHELGQNGQPMRVVDAMARAAVPSGEFWLLPQLRTAMGAYLFHPREPWLDEALRGWQANGGRAFLPDMHAEPWTDITTSLPSLDAGGRDLLAACAAHQPFHFAVEPDHFLPMMVGPVAGDLRASVRARLRGAPPESAFVPLCAFSLLDADRYDAGSSMDQSMIEFIVYANGEVDLHFDQNKDVGDPWFPSESAPGEPTELQLWCVQDQVELRIGGRRVFVSPFRYRSGTARLVRFLSSGAVGDVLSFSVERMTPAAPSPAPR